MAHISRTELVSLTRGFFACPVLIGLSEVGVLSRMSKGPFTIDELPSGNRLALTAAVDYLRSVGLVEELEAAQGFSLTRLGDIVVDRIGFFQLLHSYRDYFAEFSRLLSDSSSGGFVRRLENVTGTGQIHARKYFPKVLGWIEGRSVSCIADIGCGNGEFLSTVMNRHPNALALGVDLSPEAVTAR